MSNPERKKYFDYSPEPEPTVESLAIQVSALQKELRRVSISLAFAWVLLALTQFLY